MSVGKKTLYHVSLDFEHHIDLFIPDIPKKRAGGEDSTMKRICTSDTLEGCMIGHPNVWYHAHEYTDMEYYDPYEHMGFMTVLLDHENEWGHLMKVYEFEAEEDQYIGPEKIKQENWVPDVDKTREHWIMEPIKAKRVFYLHLTNTELVDKNQLFEYKLYESEELGRIENGCVHFTNERKKENLELTI